MQPSSAEASEKVHSGTSHTRLAVAITPPNKRSYASPLLRGVASILTMVSWCYAKLALFWAWMTGAKVLLEPTSPEMTPVSMPCAAALDPLQPVLAPQAELPQQRFPSPNHKSLLQRRASLPLRNEDPPAAFASQPALGRLPHLFLQAYRSRLAAAKSASDLLAFELAQAHGQLAAVKRQLEASQVRANGLECRLWQAEEDVATAHKSLADDMLSHKNLHIELRRVRHDYRTLLVAAENRATEAEGRFEELAELHEALQQRARLCKNAHGAPEQKPEPSEGPYIGVGEAPALLGYALRPKPAGRRRR